MVVCFLVATFGGGFTNLGGGYDNLGGGCATLWGSCVTLGSGCANLGGGCLIVGSVGRAVGALFSVHFYNTACSPLMAWSWASRRRDGDLLMVQVIKLMAWLSLSSGFTVGCTM